MSKKVLYLDNDFLIKMHGPRVNNHVSDKDQAKEQFYKKWMHLLRSMMFVLLRMFIRKLRVIRITIKMQ